MLRQEATIEEVKQQIDAAIERAREQGVILAPAGWGVMSVLGSPWETINKYAPQACPLGMVLLNTASTSTRASDAAALLGVTLDWVYVFMAGYERCPKRYPRAAYNLGLHYHEMCEQDRRGRIEEQMEKRVA